MGRGKKGCPGKGCPGFLPLPNPGYWLRGEGCSVGTYLHRREQQRTWFEGGECHLGQHPLSRSIPLPHSNRKAVLGVALVFPLQCCCAVFPTGGSGPAGRQEGACPKGFRRQNGSCVGEWGSWADWRGLYCSGWGWAALIPLNCQ